MRTVNENEMRAVSAGRPAKWVWVAGSSCSAYAKGGPIGTALMTYHRNVGCVYSAEMQKRQDHLKQFTNSIVPKAEQLPWVSGNGGHSNEV